VDELSQEKLELLNQLANSKENSDPQVNQALSQEQEILELKVKIAQLEQANNTLSSKQSFKDDNDVLRGELAGCEKRLAEKARELEELHLQYEEAVHDLQLKEHKTASLQEEVANLQQELDKVAKETNNFYDLDRFQ
jgi:chromosome segregation ATPase